ncbi:hypothetical protein F5Y01DRAFT_68601 [Xylaria sp. FL0043]|nr:hypothetical protein F5Y01DRAFT_68601 [Xylaria sp. FL0043]
MCVMCSVAVCRSYHISVVIGTCVMIHTHNLHIPTGDFAIPIGISIFFDCWPYQVIRASMSWMMITIMKSFSETAKVSNLEAGYTNIKVPSLLSGR